jgi:peroxiredoxin Q/BCP
MAIKVGDVIPNFTAKDANGGDFDIKRLIGQKTLVIYFYPKDNTPTCTKQACSFRDQYEEFKSLGAEVVGISSDSGQSHQVFAREYQLPFILLSDIDQKIRTLFGVPTNLLGLLPGRVTYVVDMNGAVVMVFDSMSGLIHISKALEAIKKLV